MFYRECLGFRQTGEMTRFGTKIVSFPDCKRPSTRFRGGLLNSSHHLSFLPGKLSRKPLTQAKKPKRRTILSFDDVTTAIESEMLALVLHPRSKAATGIEPKRDYNSDKAQPLPAFHHPACIFLSDALDFSRYVDNALLLPILLISKISKGISALPTGCTTGV